MIQIEKEFGTIQMGNEDEVSPDRKKPKIDLSRRPPNPLWMKLAECLTFNRK